jgi:hypothetical protein
MFAKLLILWISLMVIGVVAYAPNNKNLTPGQWGSICRIMTHPGTSDTTRMKTRKIIYTKYEDWAIHQSRKFLQSKPWLRQYIHPDELAIYSVQGLIHAVDKYDFSRGTDEHQGTPFFVYATKWIKGEMLRGVSELYPMTVIPSAWRKRRMHYRKSHAVKFYGDNEYMLDKFTDTSMNFATNPFRESDDYHEAWETLESIFGDDPFMKRTFRMKYSPRFESVRTNAEVAELMGCSEEHIRKKWNQYRP